jgi:hypothetical protein
MPRSLAAALAALALLVQATPAVAAFVEREHDCCCTRGTDQHRREHRCGCTDCSRRAQQAQGCPSLGGCAPDAAPVLPLDPQTILLPASDAREPAPRSPPPHDAGPAPPRGLSREVPTPPPLG